MIEAAAYLTLALCLWLFAYGNLSHHPHLPQRPASDPRERDA